MPANLKSMVEVTDCLQNFTCFICVEERAIGLMKSVALHNESLSVMHTSGSELFDILVDGCVDSFRV